MIKGFVFDLDGVITDTAVLHFKSWQQRVKDLGINYTEEDNEKLRGIPRLETLKEIIKLKKPELNLPEEELIKIADEKNEIYKKLLSTEINESSILPGVLDLLNDAKANGIKLSIASSSFNGPTILKKLGIIDMFDFIVYPGDVKQGKPAPDIFIQAAKGVGLKTTECVGFEDAPAGVKGIKDANMPAIAITHNSSEDFSNADLVLTSTSELDFYEIMKKFN
ncbi:beta-phosphoglucomutase [Mycoplasmopsis edwardii]|nr:beta-phosphoglucomutase [Mycoplasmopsis edwardii]